MMPRLRAGTEAAANGGSEPAAAAAADVGAIDAQGRPADELSFSYDGSEMDDEDEEMESRQEVQPAKVC